MNNLTFLFLLIGSLNALAQDTSSVKYAKTITADDLKKHLYIIASDEYEGRETGYPGQKKAAEYIKNHFESYGLKPGNNGSWYQEFPLKVIDPKMITIKAGVNNFIFLKDFYNFLDFSDTVLNFNNIVLAGYGINEGTYNDYETIDIADKAVMILDKEPVNKKRSSYLTDSDSLSTWSSDTKRKIKLAQDKGAAALFIVQQAEFTENTTKYKHYLETSSLKLDNNKKSKKLPVFYISQEMADIILKSADEKVEEYKKEISKKGKSEPVTANIPLTITANRVSGKISSENVLGFIEGTDKKEEIVVITAHYDHIGAHDGKVFNGADDDGTGTVTILEMAEAFAQAVKEGKRPRRSILFMPVSGEEKGLLGSEYYSENPVYPLQNTVADLNIDMIGRIDKAHRNDSNYIYIIGSDKLSTDLHNINEAANTAFTKLKLDYTFNAPDDPNRFYYRSDHYNFAKHNIPVIFYFNGVHEDYHKEGDEAHKISYDIMETRARLVFHTAWELANRPDRIKVDRTSDFKNKE